MTLYKERARIEQTMGKLKRVAIRCKKLQAVTVQSPLSLAP